MIRYQEDLAGISADRLCGFFAGWPRPPDPEMHLRILRGSAHVVLAVEEGGAVVGFVTAITDGTLSAYIPLLEVVSTHRGRGIGRELVTRLLARLGECYMIDVTCDAEVRPFYARLGFVPAGGMMIRNYEIQSGRPPQPDS